MASVGPSDPVLACPYNPSHQILKSRMQYHLVKCQRSHPTSEREVCPFNATHRIPVPEFQFHLNNCPDKRIVEEIKYHTEDEAPNGNIGRASYTYPALPPYDENWDEEVVTATYEPAHHNIRKPVLRNLQGATKSQRKKFRQQERRRVQQLNVGEEIDFEIEPVITNEHEPLRLPKINSPAIKGYTKLGLGRGSIQSERASAFISEAILQSSRSVEIGRGRGQRIP